jgi:putative ABC transport system substrate-binding protein
MMERRAFIVGGVAALAVPLAAGAQQAGRVYRIGYLAVNRSALDDAFTQGLRDEGYVDGQNIIVEYRHADGKYERLASLAGKLVSSKPDLIVSVTTPATAALRQATTTIPIVMVDIGDPVASGFAASLAHPGGNITGVSAALNEIFPKGLQLLREIVPNLSRVAWVWNPTNRSAVVGWEAIRAVAPGLGVTLQSVEIRTLEDFESAFSQMVRERPDALFVGGDHVLLAGRTRIVEFTTTRRLPGIYGSKLYVEAGGLMFFGPHRPTMYRHAASYVGKILKGAKPADLPVEQPTKYELVINGKTARTLRLTIPPSLLARADQIIE